MKGCFILTLFLLLKNDFLFGQQLQSVFDNLLTNLGSGNLYVKNIRQDQHGFMWFATSQGLIRYDGTNYRIFRHENGNPYSIPDDQVYTLLKSSDSNLYIGTRKGLCYFDEYTDRFITVLDSDFIYSLAQDQNHFIWAGTLNKGLVKINSVEKDQKSALRFTHNDSDTTSISSNTIWSIAFDHEGHGWIGTSHGLDYFNSQEKTNQPYHFHHIRHHAQESSSVSNDSTLSIFIDKNENLWFTSLRAMIDVLSAEAIKRNKFQFLHLLPIVESAFHEKITNTNTLFVDSRNNCWLGTINNGMLRFQIDDEFNVSRPVHYTYNKNNERSLPKAVWSVYEDLNHQIWIGTQTAVSKYDPRIEQFYNISLISSGFNSEETPFTGIGIDDRKAIWLINEQDTVYCLLPGKNEWHKFSLSKVTGKKGIASSVLLCSWNGDIFFGTVDGLYLLSGEEKKKFWEMKNYLPKLIALPSPEGTIKGYKYQSLCEDADGNVYAGTGRGFYFLNRKSLESEFILSNSDQSVLDPSRIIRDARVARDGTVWIASDHGLFHYFPSSKKIVSFYHRQDDSLSIPDDAVTRVTDGLNGTIWLASRTTLYSFNDSLKKFKRYDLSTSNNLFSISTLTCDEQGSIWVSTNRGIYCVSPATSQITYYTAHEGLITNLFYFAAACKSEDGLLLMGSNHGFISFFPDSIRTFSQKGKIVFTDFKLFDRSVFDKPANARLLTAFVRDKNIKLSYDQNFFTIYFADLNFSDPSVNQFEYRLSGVDNNWVKSDDRIYASYTNVRPGAHVFEVRTLAGGSNDSTNASLNLLITPPWWQTWWFYLLVFVALAIILYIVYRVRINQLLRLQLMRNRIASDLHDEIGSTLNSISLFTELAKRKTSVNIPELEEIGESSRQVIEAMSDIVWAINPANDSFPKIIIRMQSLIHRLMSAKEIDYTFDIDNEIQKVKLPMLARKNIYLILKEGVNNMVKYSSTTKAEFRLWHSDHKVKLLIRDFGGGFDIQQESMGNGLINMKRRAEDINAHLNINSEINKGTSLLLEINI